MIMIKVFYPSGTSSTKIYKGVLHSTKISNGDYVICSGLLFIWRSQNGFKTSKLHCKWGLMCTQDLPKAISVTYMFDLILLSEDYDIQFIFNVGILR